MPPILFDQCGNRKYLTVRERFAFAHAASKERQAVSTFCLTLAFTGARISEVLSLTTNRIDTGSHAIIFETLKQRRKSVFRAVPVPCELSALLAKYGSGRDGRLWPWGRTNGWKVVKTVMRKAGIVEPLCKPKALRHAFAIESVQNGVPLNIVQRWMGHSRLDTTAIYANALGDEERNLARASWRSLESIIESCDPSMRP